MIKNVKSDDGLEEVKEKLGEVINVLLWNNPEKTVTKIANNLLKSYESEINKSISEHKSTLSDVKKVLETISKKETEIKEHTQTVTSALSSCEKEIKEYRQYIDSELDNFIKKTKNAIDQDNKVIEDKINNFTKQIDSKYNDIKNKMTQFISFYAQVGLHIKEMCDGKK